MEQSALDQERNSGPAVAPLRGSWIVGVGSRDGWLRARRGTDGGLLWSVNLSGGSVQTTKVDNLPLSSVIANDVDGDGAVDFVVGDAAGWLYAVNAENGRLKWSIDLGGPCGLPIAADIDGDGTSEILVPAGGYLIAVGSR